MQPEDRDVSYLWDMLEHARIVIDITQGESFDSYSKDRVKQLALERLVGIIGEAAGRVSMPFRDRHPEIPWQKIIGQRNVLAHEYDKILHEVLWATATLAVPDLVEKIAPLLPPPREVPKDKL